MERPSALQLVLLFIAAATAIECSVCTVSYRSGTRPLLFGGLYEQNSCSGQCQPRNDTWGKKCEFKRGSAWGICTEQQAKSSYELVKTLGGGAILDFSPCDLIPYLRGRTLWLIGDSHTKTLYRAVQCFLIDFWDHTECQANPFADYNNELLKLPEKEGNSNCIHLLGKGGGRVCMVEVVLGSSLVNNTKVAEGGVLPLLRAKFARKQDIFVINFGLWHKRSGGNWSDYSAALHALGQYYQSTLSVWPHVLFRESPASHPGDTATKKCKQVPGYSYVPATGQLLSSAAAAANTTARWMLGQPLTDTAAAILNRYNLTVISGYNISVPLYDNHIEMNWAAELDCTHYCHPGLPQAWLWYVYEVVKQGKASIVPLPIISSKQQQLAAAAVGRSRAADQSVYVYDSATAALAAVAPNTRYTALAGLQQQQQRFLQYTEPAAAAAGAKPAAAVATQRLLEVRSQPSDYDYNVDAVVLPRSQAAPTASAAAAAAAAAAAVVAGNSSVPLKSSSSNRPEMTALLVDYDYASDAVAAVTTATADTAAAAANAPRPDEPEPLAAAAAQKSSSSSSEEYVYDADAIAGSNGSSIDATDVSIAAATRPQGAAAAATAGSSSSQGDPAAADNAVDASAGQYICVPSTVTF